jgi:hypothetical protein
LNRRTKARRPECLRDAQVATDVNYDPSKSTHAQIAHPAATRSKSTTDSTPSLAQMPLRSGIASRPPAVVREAHDRSSTRSDHLLHTLTARYGSIRPHVPCQTPKQTFRTQFLQVAVRQATAEKPTQCVHDHFWREPEPGKSRC